MRRSYFGFEIVIRILAALKIRLVACLATKKDPFLHDRLHFYKTQFKIKNKFKLGVVGWTFYNSYYINLYKDEKEMSF